MFDQPVIPLRIAEQQDQLPQPLQINPPLAGKGEWLNTAVYVFRPESVLQSNTTYTITVPAGLADNTRSGSAPLPQDYTWNFHTMPPAVKDVTLVLGPEPQDQEANPSQQQNKISLNDQAVTPNIPLDAWLQIQFFQAMDPAAAEAALSLVPVDSGGQITGTPAALNLSWNDNHTLLEARPQGNLPLGVQYALILGPTAQAVDGGVTGSEKRWLFQTVRPPQLINTTPANGAQRVEPYLELTFASPINLQSVLDNVVIDPPLTREDNMYYDLQQFRVVFYGLKYSTNYQVQIGPGIQDLYGNQIQTAYTLSFSTHARDKQAYLSLPDRAFVRAGQPFEFYLRLANVSQAQLALYRLSFDRVADFERIDNQMSLQNYLPPSEDLVWQQTIQPDLLLDESKLVKVTAEAGAPLPSGFYFLTLEAPGVDHPGSTFLDSRMVFVSPANLTIKVGDKQALLWLTDLSSGTPMSGVPVRLYDRQFQLAGEGQTDQDGLLQLPIPAPNPSDYYYGGGPFFAVAGDLGALVAYAATQWGSGVSTYDFGIVGEYYQPPQPNIAYLYTERPLYRPGQKVYFKGIVRQDDDLDYSLPSEKSVEVSISSFDEEVYHQTLPISDFGSFNGTFDLDTEAALGSYTMTARFPGQTDLLGMVDFSVAEYRRPEFQVSVEAAPVNVLAGEFFSANLRAEYYSGGGVSDASVHWTLRSQSFSFTPPPTFSRYTFSDFERDSVDLFQSNPRGETDNLVAEGDGSTDAQGLLTLTIPADIQKDSSQRLVLEATITDVAGAAVSGRTDVIAHRGMVYPGLRFQRYVGQEGQPQTIELAALDWDGNPVAGQTVDVQVVERRWHSVQEQDARGNVKWTTSVEEIPVAEMAGVTLDASGKGSVQFTPPVGGVYRARVTARDARGNENTASDYLWVAGKEYIPWRQSNDRSFQLIIDRENYQPGDTAEILIASPFQGSTYALVTVERGRIRKQEVLQLDSNSAVYRLPISADMAPNVYLSVTVVKGVDETNPHPDFQISMTELKVDTDQQSLKVDVQPDRSTAGPDDEVTYTVHTTDVNGAPVKAEVSLGLSDLATLSLADPNSKPILAGFYSRRNLRVWTAVPIVNSLELHNAFLAGQAEDSGQGMGSGGGKGEGELGVIEVRQDFPDTAFWQADLQTDDTGQAAVTVKLPDNLTTWRMDARAVTLDTRVGQTTHDLVSTKPLLVRPQTPRFFVSGDQAQVGTAVHNNTDQDLSVVVQLNVENAQLGTPASQSIDIPARRQAYVSWQVSIPDGVDRVQMTFMAQGGSYTDASRPTIGAAGLEGLPVYRYEAPETVSTSGQLMEEGARAEAIYLPEGWNVSQGDLSISVAPSLSASLTDGLDYLKHYPYECTEQTISRFLPNVAVARVMREAGVQDAALEEGLQEQVNLALQRLSSWQNVDGGWGQWKSDPSDSLVTSYVVLGLLEAQQSGYSVPTKMLSDAVSFLRTATNNSPQSMPYPEKALKNRQAFVLLVRTMVGDAPSSQLGSLYDSRLDLQLYARAYLAQAIWLIDPQDPRLDTLRSDFTSSAVLSASGTHWEESEADRWNWNSDVRTTAIVLNTLEQMDPQNPLLANSVRWLMSHRSQGHWQSTQETAWTLLSLANWMRATGELQANYDYAVGLNDQTIGQGQANASTLRDVWTTRVQVSDLLKDTANNLVFARSGGSGNLYYTANMTVYLPVKDVQALDRGISISRSYYLPDDMTAPVTQAAPGTLLRARLTIIAPSALHYVVVNDPLPAGLEAVDTSLLTSPQGEAPQQYSWSDWEKSGWGWWYFNHAELRDEQVVLSANYLPAGTYVYTYLVRTGAQGTFNVIPPTAQEIYFPEVYGRGEGAQFEVK